MARTKKARRIRTQDEFQMSQLRRLVAPPQNTGGVDLWTIAQIVDARNQQLFGSFALPARLAISMRTDDALFTARTVRLAPVQALEPEIIEAKGARAKPIAKEAEAAFGVEGVGIECGTMADINGDLADHGVAIGYNTPSVREDGSRVDFLHRHWPIEHVRFDHPSRTLVTRIDPGSPLAENPPPDFVDEETGRTLFRSGNEVPIVHGDGRWVVYQKHSYRPWRQDAAILPGAMIWARHAHAVRDWAKASTAHGNAKVVGELPPGMPLTDPDGNIQAEAMAMLELVKGVARLDTPAGLVPNGAKLNYIMNASRAWEVWNQLVMNAEKAAARVYLGTDGILGATGGAPGVDITTLFGVSTTRVQGDLDALKIGFSTGVLEPWTAINFGDSSLSPTRRYAMPDPDAQAEAQARSQRVEAFYAELALMTQAGFLVNQEVVNDLAKAHGIQPPQLPAGAAPTAPDPAATPDAAPPLRVV